MVGSVYCELQDAEGKVISGYALAECDRVLGDQIERVVSWKGGSDLRALVGKPVRLRFKMKDVDLYSIRFR